MLATLRCAISPRVSKTNDFDPEKEYFALNPRNRHRRQGRSLFVVILLALAILRRIYYFSHFRPPKRPRLGSHALCVFSIYYPPEKVSLAPEIRTLENYPSLKVSPGREKHHILQFLSTRLSKIPPSRLQKSLVYLFCALLAPLAPAIAPAIHFDASSISQASIQNRCQLRFAKRHHFWSTFIFPDYESSPYARKTTLCKTNQDFRRLNPPDPASEPILGVLVLAISAAAPSKSDSER